MMNFWKVIIDECDRDTMTIYSYTWKKIQIPRSMKGMAKASGYFRSEKEVIEEVNKLNNEIK